MNPHCTHSPARVCPKGTPYDAAKYCRRCWIHDNGEPEPPPARALPCLFIGEVLDKVGCECPGRWLRRCSVHSVCTLQTCKTCPDYFAE